MLISIALALLLTFLTVAVHATGTSWWIESLKRKEGNWVNRPLGWTFHAKPLGTTACVLCLLHLIEVAMWALCYYLLPQLDSIRSFEEAVYFSTVTFTSLGYGDIVLTGSFRILSGIQAMCGLMIFGWSSALFFAVVQRVFKAAADLSRTASQSKSAS